jgi:hypothetical protein
VEHPGDIFSNASVELLTTENKLKREKCKYNGKVIFYCEQNNYFGTLLKLYIKENNVEQPF